MALAGGTEDGIEEVGRKEGKGGVDHVRTYLGNYARCAYSLHVLHGRR